MKRQILLFAAIAISSVALAQSKSSVSFRAGVTSSDMRGDAANSLNNIVDYTNGMIRTQSRTGFFAGASTSIPISENISIEPGLYFAQKGYELRGDLNIKAIEFLGVNARAALQTNYVDLPVLVKANVGGLEIFAGPQVSYLANADLRYQAGALGFNVVNQKTDVSDQFSRIDAGLTGGLGYQFGNGFNIRASYDHGLTKTDANRNMDAYNRSIKLGVGFRF